MKKKHGLIAVMMAATLFSLSGSADEPFEGIGKGRLLKKWRDDLFGKPDQPTRPRPPTQKSNGTPTPALSQHPGQHPNQAARQRSNMAQPTSPQRGYPGNNRQSTADAHSRHQQSVPRSNQPNPNANPARQSLPAQAPARGQTQGAGNATRSNAVATQGFGMLVETKDEKTFFVTQIDRKGNAAHAGVQRGDMVLKVGGTKLVSIEELNEICKILTPGDQLEFQISQHGKANTVMVQFGEAKNLPAVAPGPRESAPASNRAASVLGNRAKPAPVVDTRLSRNNQNSSRPAGRYDFVPPQSESQYQSVLEQPGSMRPPTRPASYSRSPQNGGATRGHDDDQARRTTIDLRSAFGESILEGSR